MIKEILGVFSKEYREETKYRECLEKSLQKMCLCTGNSCDEENIVLLADKGFQSNFKINMNAII